MSEVMTILVDRKIKTALTEADAGDFASDEEVKAQFSKWRRGGC
jgi:hypothetical protein